MTGRADPIAVVEAAYRWEPDLKTWLDGIVQALSPYDVGGGMVAYTVGVQRPARTSEPRGSPAAMSSAALLRTATERFPTTIAKLAYAPTEHVGNVAYRLARLSRETGMDLGPIANTLPDAWALVAGDPMRESLALVFPRAGRSGAIDERFPHPDRKQLGCIGAHLGAALRLRELVAPTADDAEAVITPDGSVVHARGGAREHKTRTSLADAVLRSEHARGRLRRVDPDEAIRQWSALVQGRWTLVDTVERDGKRYVLACENQVRAGDPSALTADESAVAWLAACGHSYKYIAYELGLTLGVVTSRLRRAMRKLRVASRSELLAKFGIESR